MRLRREKPRTARRGFGGAGAGNGPAMAACEVCGNDEADQFITEEDFEALSGDDKKRR